MCGIVGYIGKKQAQPILFNSLMRLEYRGYDSSGVAVRGDSIQICKDKVRVEALHNKASVLQGTSGIGHTRWATHGEPSQVNAHPHCDCTGRLAVVHNGVITNYEQLKGQLIKEGHRFLSETDTEVISHLIEKYYLGDIGKASQAALEKIEGCYAVAVLAADDPRLLVARNGCPLVIGIGDNEIFIASDIPAILDYTDRIVYLEDGDVAVITPGGVKVANQSKDVRRQECRISWSVDNIQKGGYEHFMNKEIHEQPKVIRDTISEYLASNVSFAGTWQALGSSEEDLLIFACGTSYHAGITGKYIMEDLPGVPVRVEIASEVNHRERISRVRNAIGITQSGETADVLTAIKKLKETGTYISVITNVRGSSASRAADETIYISAGPEISVAATKSFIAQLTVLYLLALSHPDIDDTIRKNTALELRLLPNYVQQVLDNDGIIEQAAMFLSQYSNVFFIGRGINYPIALEGALKLKEISYIHAEGFAAGELKHGPFSLLQPDTPVVALLAPDKTYDSMMTNIKEVKSRKSPVVAVVSEGDMTAPKLADMVINVPHTPNIFSPVINAIVVQLLAYYTAKCRACPIDFPRNLAKSVTVE